MGSEETIVKFSIENFPSKNSIRAGKSDNTGMQLRPFVPGTTWRKHQGTWIPATFDNESAGAGGKPIMSPFARNKRLRGVCMILLQTRKNQFLSPADNRITRRVPSL